MRRFYNEEFKDFHKIFPVYLNNKTFLQYLYSTSIAPDSKPCIEWLSEWGMYSVEESHCVWDTIKCQYCSLVVYIHSYFWRNRHWYGCTLTVVHEGALRLRAVQTPGFVIPAKAANIVTALPACFLVSYSYVHFCTTPFNLPVVSAPSHTLPAQHLLPVVESLWMLRVWVGFTAHLHHCVSLGQVKVWVSC